MDAIARLYVQAGEVATAEFLTATGQLLGKPLRPVRIWNWNKWQATEWMHALAQARKEAQARKLADNRTAWVANALTYWQGIVEAWRQRLDAESRSATDLSMLTTAERFTLDLLDRHLNPPAREMTDEEKDRVVAAVVDRLCREVPELRKQIQAAGKLARRDMGYGRNDAA